MVNENLPLPMTGRCGCDGIQYRINKAPMFVHCCHCTSCQRETGSAFAINYIVETEHLELLPASTETPMDVNTPSESGRGQMITRCPKCFVAVWSDYSGGSRPLRFVRVGTLDEEFKKAVQPSIHIFCRSRLPWEAPLGGQVPAVDVYYNRDDHWPKESIDRLAALLAAKDNK